MTSHVLKHVRRILLSTTDPVDVDAFVSDPASQVWFNIMTTISDSYALERISDQLLHQLANEHASDVEAYWTLWILFHQIIEDQVSVRLAIMFLTHFA